MGATREDRGPIPAATTAAGGATDGPADEPLSEERASRIIEEFESEAPTRQVTGPWRLVVGLLAAALAVYALYWTQFSIVTQVYRASFLLLTLVLTFLLYPAFSGDHARPSSRDLLVRFGVAIALGVVVIGWARGFETGRNLALLALVFLAFAAYPLLKAAVGRRQEFFDIPLSVLGAVAAGYVVARATERWAGDRFGLDGGAWRWAAIAVALAGSAALYPLLRRLGEGRDRVALYDLHLATIAGASLAYIVFNYQAALQRVTNPTGTELLLGALAIVLTLEATRRTTGWALPLVAVVFLFYARYGNQLPAGFLDDKFGHRGYQPNRIIGQNFLTLEGLFGLPLDVAATFIVLFTIYGAVLEYSGAGKFFIDWSFAALGRSRGGTGPGRTVTAAGFLLGTVSGSGVATTVTLGSLAWPMLKRAGFQRDTAGGLLSAAGIGALLSPPTLGAAAFIIAEYLNVSYLQVLLYATIPTVLYYLSCLLMMEADSRRMRTHAVDIETPPLRELTLKYGYHFSSLFVIVILLALDQTPFMAVFWSIVVAFALSFLRPETRLTSFWALGAGAALALVLAVTGQRPSVACFWGMLLAAVISAAFVLQRRLAGRRDGGPPAASAAGAAAAGVGSAGFATTVGAEPGRFLQALEAGGKGVVSIAATTATAGIIVSIVTLTGLGLKLSGIIVDTARDISPNPSLVLFFTIIFAALAVWVLGLAVPVTASYIIAAVTIVKAFTDLGVEPAAAHMFIFYYAVLADVSPPTALAPFAAAAITGGNPFRTTMLAWKYCLPAFLVPFMFTLSPQGTSLLMIGAPLTILWSFVTACLAVALLAVAFGGWLIRQANPLERVLAGVAGLALLFADPRADAAGFVLLAIVLALHLLRVRAAAAPAGAAAD